MSPSRVVIGALLVAACGLDELPKPDGELELRELIDLDPAPNVVEVELVAERSSWEYFEGRVADVMGYRDASAPPGTATVPGPLLRGRLGDEVIVHFRNDLPTDTTIHWHGLKVPIQSDGSPASQAPVPPGGTFEYRFTLTEAGTFWYHPHVDGETQIEAGLQAPLIVEGGAYIGTDADRMFVLDDVKLEADGTLSQRTTGLDLMMGRQGNVVLVNGRAESNIVSQRGARERWRFVNTANGRFFKLDLPGHEFLVIGSDAGLFGDSYWTDQLLIAPGERYEVLVWLEDAGDDDLWLRTVHHDRGHNLPDAGPQPLFRIDFDGEVAERMPEVPSTLGWTAPLAVPASAPVRTVVMTEEEPEQTGGEPRFFFNGLGFPHVPDVEADLGSVEIWEIDNDTEMDHPFHLHGTFFQVLDVDGETPATRMWKDTVIVPMEATLRFAVHYDNPGLWMYHCHILEHAERGMMGRVHVAEPLGDPPPVRP